MSADESRSGLGVPIGIVADAIRSAVGSPEYVARIACEDLLEAGMLRHPAIYEAQRLREAIADALADLTPGIAPHDSLARALSGESL